MRHAGSALLLSDERCGAHLVLRGGARRASPRARGAGRGAASSTCRAAGPVYGWAPALLGSCRAGSEAAAVSFREGPEQKRVVLCFVKQAQGAVGKRQGQWQRRRPGRPGRLLVRFQPLCSAFFDRNHYVTNSVRCVHV